MVCADLPVNTPTVTDKDARGKFVAGNQAARSRSNGIKRRDLTSLMFDLVDPSEFTAMARNMIRIAKGDTQTSAIKAFGTICDVLGLKSSSLELTGADAELSPEDRVRNLRLRMSELLTPQAVVPQIVNHE